MLATLRLASDPVKYVVALAYGANFVDYKKDARDSEQNEKGNQMKGEQIKTITPTRVNTKLNAALQVAYIALRLKI